MDGLGNIATNGSLTWTGEPVNADGRQPWKSLSAVGDADGPVSTLARKQRRRVFQRERSRMGKRLLAMKHEDGSGSKNEIE